jgi:hypothetical protein
VVLKFGAVKVICSVLDPDTARNTAVSFTGGSISQRNQEAGYSLSTEAVK